MQIAAHVSACGRKHTAPPHTGKVTDSSACARWFVSTNRESTHCTIKYEKILEALRHAKGLRTSYCSS